MASFVILLTARTARIACSDVQTYIQTHETTTVTLSAHARRGLIIVIMFTTLSYFLILMQSFVMLSYIYNATLSDYIKGQSIRPQTIHKLEYLVLPNIYLLLNSILCALFIPLMNHFFVPCVPSMTIRERMGIGMAISITGLVSATYVEGTLPNLGPLHKVVWYTVPSILLSVQEIFTIVSSKSK